MKHEWFAGMALVAALAGCSGPPPVEPAPRAVLVRTLGADAEAGLRMYAGEVRARVENDLGFRIGGKLVERKVDVGDAVRAGDLLARLDAADVALAAAAAVARVEAARADLVLARSELKRNEELHVRGFISASALDARRTAVEAAEAAERAARAQADSAANQTAYAELRAVEAGVVTAVMAEPGSVLAAGQAVVRFARPSEREVLIHVPESRVANLRAGMPATVLPLAGAARPYAAQVREIAPAADAATRSFAVRVAVPEADDGLPLGASARVAFAGQAAGALRIPLAALTERGGQPAVWVVDDGQRVRPLAVEVGEYAEDGVEVLAGLPADARLVVAGVHLLVEGEAVRAVDERAPASLDVRR
ncbi:efflux RND transporter periplasmic adaptor subunit [Pseudothauera nasutitermitis]|uniref:Efflux RND transporter periplasmic adaptor subunit n=1 Tax=Pseudothauera nasutitermitis TaxID=2565930 RepID=A0A4S4AQC2_9RHOO|nr:efflux RND transporter periplasmic adaptor subunit [Pseudothauera nasutitermitis]THF61935.1 efflux RND transporter periplasmic adaptor subunit [Pseudothauera nasutitermitis]